MRVWQTIRASELSWHSHQEAYAALVLSGGYEEAGDCGRFLVESGDVIFHGPFEVHVDRMFSRGTVLLNLPLPEQAVYHSGKARVADFDSVVRTAERNTRDAAEMLLFSAHAEELTAKDWPDQLAIALMENPSLKLCQWAEQMGLAPWTVSRSFRKLFGVSPEAFRARVRARQAWKLIQNTQEPLAKIAVNLGFADQSHMTRGVKQLTDFSPKMWRVAANGFTT